MMPLVGVKPPQCHFTHFAVCSRHHQIILDVLAAVIAGAFKVKMLLELLLAVSRQVEEVHIADCQLGALRDLLQSPQLDPGERRKRVRLRELEDKTSCTFKEVYVLDSKTSKPRIMICAFNSSSFK